MNKAELVAAMAEKAGLSKKDAEKALGAFVESVRDAVKVGDKVIYSKYSGTEVEVEDEKYVVVKQNDILAVIE